MDPGPGNSSDLMSAGYVDRRLGQDPARDDSTALATLPLVEARWGDAAPDGVQLPAPGVGGVHLNAR